MAHDCLWWLRRTHPARRPTTAVSCVRVRRSRAPATRATRCPCATHDRYTQSTKHHSHFGYRMERTHRRSLGHFRLRCSRFLICTRTAFYDFSWFYFVWLCFCHARALIILLRNLNLFHGDETATNQKLPCFFLYNTFQISDSLVIFSHTCVQLGVRN